jgi:formylglycine-generating enzyme required for sulfatase activity
MRKRFPICLFLMLCVCLIAVIFSGCGGAGGPDGPGGSGTEYTLVVTVAPQGAGSVMLDPAGGKYKSGTNVILRPVANDGYEFTDWDGDNKADLAADYDHWKIKMNGHKKIIATFAELLPNQVASPTAVPVGGMVAAGSKITLSVTTDGATIYYTVDGSTPTSASTVYNASAKPTVPDGGLTLKAIAAKAEMIGSNIATFHYSTPRPIEQQSCGVGGVSFEMRLAPACSNFPYGMFEETEDVDIDFWIAETEVTCELWHTVRTWANDPVRGAQRYFFQSEYLIEPPIEEQKLKPAFYISWRDAIVWCNALTEYYNATNSKALACVYTYGGQVIRDSRDENSVACDQAIMATGAKGFRLPISKEWEMAARYIDGIEWLPYNHASGDTSGNCYPDVSSTRIGDYVWYADNSGASTHPVATRQPNHLGLYDMSGNLSEFCFEIHPGSDKYRVLRGGDCFSKTGTYFLMVSYENWASPVWGTSQYGFRFVATK